MTLPICAIIGAGAGLGMAVARRFGREGFAVALVARSEDKLASSVAELEAAGIEAWAYAADAGDADALAGTLDRIAVEHGAIDVLVYNAVAFTPGPLSAIAPDAVSDDLRVSTAGALSAVQTVLPRMREAGAGSLLFTGGGAALGPIPNLTTLSIAKAALRLVALGLAQELAGSGIRVGTVAIFGGIAPGTAFDPDRIAESYWYLHTLPATSDEVEINYRGE